MKNPKTTILGLFLLLALLLAARWYDDYSTYGRAAKARRTCEQECQKKCTATCYNHP